jgi:guanylate kinase
VSGAAPDETRAPDAAGVSAPLLVVLSGPSGVGKDAVLDALARRGHRFHRVVTCTTRPRRDGEADGVDYHFISDEAFDRTVAQGGFLEHAVVYGHRSGVPKDQVVGKLREGVDVYVRTDVQGAATIRGLTSHAVLVFLAPSSLDEIEQRIRARGADDEDRIRRRLDTAREEMARRDEFDHVIVNEPGRLGETVDRLVEVLDAERAKPRPEGAGLL